MIIIADSGGSKIDWRLMAKSGSLQPAHSAGFNPYYQPIEDLEKSIASAVVPLAKEEVKKIFFYGAGVSSEKNQEVIRNTFAKFFPSAVTFVGWDLLAAGRALCGKEPGIACIMGTGSNSCLYDGNDIAGNVANLGWILADEGSGANIGRKFLVEYLREKQPAAVASKFRERYPLTREQFLEKVYQGERPSAFLASFTRFIHDNLNEEYCMQLMVRCFNEFYEEVVMRYENYDRYKAHFVGSIAFHFSDILRRAGADKGITVGNIMEGPIDGLTRYHESDLA
ncbi:MAG: N-acetylglucosamine kinase [Bacteroidetes bacterium]|nr:N-acetylglucosamine kinase [Bacteroidota bacterium]